MIETYNTVWSVYNLILIYLLTYDDTNNEYLYLAYLLETE